MRTIAVTVDEEMLRALDRLAAARSGRRARRNRSELVRAAVGEYLARQARTEREAEEWRVWSRNLDRINAQAAGLVAEQAEP